METTLILGFLFLVKAMGREGAHLVLRLVIIERPSRYVDLPNIGSIQYDFTCYDKIRTVQFTLESSTIKA